MEYQKPNNHYEALVLGLMLAVECPDSESIKLENILSWCANMANVLSTEKVKQAKKEAEEKLAIKRAKLNSDFN